MRRPPVETLLLAISGQALLAGGMKIKTVRKPSSGDIKLEIQWSKPATFAVPIPPDEPQRLEALRRYDILDTPPERNFDAITLLAAHICDTPIALMVLIDQNRQWFKSQVGVGWRETPREFAVCAHTIMKRKLLVVPDLSRDKRFAANPLVYAGPKFRFYAGAPLITPDNRALGTLCVVDKVRRTLTVSQKKDLISLSRLIMTELELRRLLRSR
jgi:GAF domain-containing protein